MTSEYRPALDGLRAVAVLAVIAYHLGLPLPGGFLGVDVFFVLSGYLITGLLLTEYRRTDHIRLSDFWARRVRRLMPALLLVVVTSAMVINRLSPALDLQPRRHDVFATLAYYANWHFINVAQSYFAGYTGASPLRHTWSLAIEEQFYIVWPLIVLAMLRVFRGRIVPMLIIVCSGAAASAWAMAWLYNPADPSRAYYGTDARAHELLLGALVALVLSKSRVRREAQRFQRQLRMAGFVLFGLVLVTMVTVTDRTAAYYHGGSFAFCAAVALLLFGLDVDQGSEVGGLLSTSPLVGVGRMSYGLYLWHWPLIVWLDGPSSNLRRLMCVALTFVAAAASYRLIELPVRQGRIPWLRQSRRRLLFVAPVAIIVAGAIGVSATASADTAVVDQLTDQSVTACARAAKWCVRVQRPTPNAVLVATAGDSTVLALDPGLRDQARARGFGYVQAGRNGCSFAPVAMQADDPAAEPLAELCAKRALPLLDDVTAHQRPDVWIISDRLLRQWLHDGGHRYPIGTPEHDLAAMSALRRTLSHLTNQGARIVLLEALPDGQPVDCALRRRPKTCGDRSSSLDNPDTVRLNAMYRAAASAFPGRVSFVPLRDLVCPGASHQCRPLQAGLLVRYDGVHFTKRFSEIVVPKILDRIERAGIDLSR